MGDFPQPPEAAMDAERGTVVTDRHQSYNRSQEILRARDLVKKSKHVSLGSSGSRRKALLIPE